ncbi:hypothetical protein FQA39_LY06759 [Lamprigera yunnana]|nr:hypothetical protein FQA39_LY06759 [Lamprigera yunnana]
MFFVLRHRIQIKNAKNLTPAELEAIGEVICNTDSEEELLGDPDTSEDESVEESGHHFGSEEELTSSDTSEEESWEQESDKYIGKNKKSIWCKTPATSKFDKHKAKNIIKKLTVPKQCARDITAKHALFF